MASERFRRFKDISVSERILNTVFLLTIGLGYLAALANLYYTHQGLDGKAGLSIEDVVVSYHGSNTQTRLGTAIKGIMKPNLRYASDQDVILEWIRSGADEPDYHEKVAPILNRDCIICHTPGVNPSLPDLTHYAGVAEVAHGGGATIPTLVRVSHIHLFGIAFILFFIGKIFLLCDINVYIKRIAVVIPFAAMLLDVISWFITKSTPSFAYVVVISGALMGMSMGLQILLSVYQMWFYPRKPDQGC
jgi:NADH:ubiquinone oxidoreductase subunit K